MTTLNKKEKFMTTQYTDRLITLCTEGEVLSKVEIFDALMKFLSADEIKRFCLTAENDSLRQHFEVIDTINFAKDGEHFDYCGVEGCLSEFLEENGITKDADDLDILGSIEDGLRELGSYNEVLPWGEHGSLYIDVNLKPFNE